MKKGKSKRRKVAKANANSPKTQQGLFVFVVLIAALSTGNVQAKVFQCSCGYQHLAGTMEDMCHYTVYVYIFDAMWVCVYICMSGSETIALTCQCSHGKTVTPILPINSNGFILSSRNSSAF